MPADRYLPGDRRPRWHRHTPRTLASLAGVSALCGVLVAGLALPVAAVLGLTTRDIAQGFQNFPLALHQSPIPQRSVLLSAAGKPVAYFYKENRQDISLKQVSPVMKRAMVAIEDSRFYQHGAIDLKGTIRALINNASNSSTQGGSTLTQQLVKMTLLEQATTKAQRIAATADSYARKIRELKYAMAYEATHSKHQILNNYLNIAYFGDGAYGIEIAAQHYFSVHASQLSLPQAALLAGLVQNPTYYDPTTYPQNALARRNTVLARMAQLGELRQRRADKLMKTGLGLKVTTFTNGCVNTAAPFYCSYVQSYLLNDSALGTNPDTRNAELLGGGLTIQTTLSLRDQKATDKSVHAHVFPTDNAVGAMALVQPGTGKVMALSQSRPMGNNAKAGQTYLNFTVPKQYGDANGFQAGSTFKAFVLATALQEGYPATTAFNSPWSMVMPAGSYTNCSGYPTAVWPVNSSTTSGYMDAYKGTRLSVNTYFAQLEKLAGLCPSVKTARDAGVVVPKQDEVGPFTLGVTDVSPLTMAAAYATWPARGMYCQPMPVTSVTDVNGKVLKTWHRSCHRVVKPAVADQINDILRGVQQPGGFGYDLGHTGLNIPSAAKTGTTDKNVSVWYMGYTPSLVAAAMIAGANSQGSQISLNGQTVGNTFITDASGSGAAGPMWAGAMQVIQNWLPNIDFHKVDQSKLGGAVISVPSVGGMSVTDATNALKKAGFNPQVSGSDYSGYPAGTVAYTIPGTGSTAYKGQAVQIIVSNGPAPVQKPPPTHKPPGGGGGGGGGKPPHHHHGGGGGGHHHH
ncbi:MAG: transglycosylase domain-containing protein [Nocardioidaceae bacterium]